MQNSNPFTIRLQLIQLAKDLLIDEYHTNREHILEKWRLDVDLTRTSGLTPQGCPSLPSYPSEVDILKKAEALNQFVSKTK